MRTVVFILLLPIILMSFSKPANLPVLVQTVGYKELSASKKTTEMSERIINMKIRDIEKLIGRKFTLKEKIEVKIFQIKTKKAFKKSEEKSSKGKTALLLGILGLLLFFIPFGIFFSLPLAILAIIKGSKAQKENPGDKKGKTAKILGFITLGLFLLGIILALSWAGF